MCTYGIGKDACSYDSGGPVLYPFNRHYLLGIISYGMVCAAQPGVNARVTSFLDWIRSNSADNFCYKKLS